MGLRIALFGQAAFGRDVLIRLLEAGHRLVGIHTPPEGARPDPLAEEGAGRGLPVFHYRRYRRKGAAIPEIVEEYRALGAELNVLAYVTAILPPEIVDAPPHRSLCFHPSLLPRFRGGAALAWQIILGERESGVTVFRPDAGVDTGPIVVQKGGVAIDAGMTAGRLYFDHLYPLGVEALVEAVAHIEAGTARLEPQDESRATFQGLVTDEDARIDWSRPADELDRLIRGCDPQPGALCRHGEDEVRLFDGGLLPAGEDAEPGTVLGVESDRLLIAARDGRLAVGRLRVAGDRKIPAAEARLGPGTLLV